VRTPFLAILAAAGALLTFAGCPGSTPTDDGTDASTDDAYVADDAAAFCAAFTHSGDPCAQASGIICFRQCKTDGCQCKTGTDGTARWACTTDFSCEPDGSPLEDATPPDTDADSDSGTDAGADADSDSGTDADAGADADADTASDADGSTDAADSG
jgi:hypothetical protein